MTRAAVILVMATAALSVSACSTAIETVRGRGYRFAIPRTGEG